MSHWGSYRDDESIHNFQLAIRQTKPPLHLVTQHDTHLANAVVAYRDIWTRNRHNTVHNTTPQHPLQNPITIQICHAAHFTTQIPNNNEYFYYDSLRMPITSPVYKLNANLRSWYTHTPLPPSLTSEPPIPPHLTPINNTTVELRESYAHSITLHHIPRMSINPPVQAKAR